MTQSLLHQTSTVTLGVPVRNPFRLVTQSDGLRTAEFETSPLGGTRQRSFRWRQTRSGSSRSPCSFSAAIDRSAARTQDVCTGARPYRVSQERRSGRFRPADWQSGQ